MKFKRLLLLLIAVFLFVNVSAQWAEYTCNETGYSASFPVSPETSVKEKESGNSYKAKAKKGAVSFIVSAKKRKNQKEGVDGLLKTSLDAYANALKGTIEEEKEIEVDGKKGLEAKVKGEKANVNYRVFFSGKKMYQMQVVAVNEFAAAEDVEKFFNSFSFTDKGKEKN